MRDRKASQLIERSVHRFACTKNNAEFKFLQTLPLHYNFIGQYVALRIDSRSRQGSKRLRRRKMPFGRIRWLGNGAVPDRCKMGPRWKAAKIAATPISIWNTWISSCFINSSQGTHDAGEYFCTLTRTGSIDIFELYQQFKLQSHGWHSCCGMRGILRCNYNHERSGANHVANAC